MVPFAPRLIPVILSSLAHHVGTIRAAANDTNYNLYKVIQDLPAPLSPPIPSSPHDLTAASPVLKEREVLPVLSPSAAATTAPLRSTLAPEVTLATSPTLSPPDLAPLSIGTGVTREHDPFDYGATVNALTLQFLNEHEETRVAALEWLLMLHQKAPKKVSRSILSLDLVYQAECALPK